MEAVAAWGVTILLKERQLDTACHSLPLDRCDAEKLRVVELWDILRLLTHTLSLLLHVFFFYSMNICS